jgi:hypothetical protein
LAAIAATANVLMGGVLDALEGRLLDDEIEFLRGSAHGQRACGYFASIAQAKGPFSGPTVAAPIVCAVVLQAAGAGEGVWGALFVGMREKEVLRRHFLLDESFQHFIFVADKVGWTTDALAAFVALLPEVSWGWVRCR